MSPIKHSKICLRKEEENWMYPQKVKHAASTLVSSHESNIHILQEWLYFIGDIKSNLQLSFAG